jgi:hypothetical protein
MEANDLYGLPLDRFVPERTALAKALRGQGQRDEATRVAKLAKPSVAAWAVNQLVRTQRRGIEDLIAAGDALQAAQEDVIAGRGSAAALREAAERERAVASELLDAARGLLSSEGHGLTQATLDRVADTLHAAALDSDAQSEVRDGCLTRELRHVGLGGGLAAASPGGTEPTVRSRARPRAGSTSTKQGARPTERAKAATTSKTPTKEDTGTERRREAAERKKAEAAAREREQRRKTARADAASARRAVEAAERNLRTAEQRRDRAASVLRDADEAVSAAESRVKEAVQASDEAQRALDQI